MIAVPDDAGDVVRTIAFGTHATTHQLLDQKIAREVELQHEVDGK